MKNSNTAELTYLTQLETQQINGGSDQRKGNLWSDLIAVVAHTVDGLIEFGKQGGRNAGICVK
ncbi:MAG: hypothetical protein ACQUHE_10380 [Bacteroidia bacterium]